MTRSSLVDVLAQRLAREALVGLESLSGGQDDFMLFMLHKVEDLLATVCPQLEASWKVRDFPGMANEIHKLRASVSYIGALQIDALVSECEPLLRKHSGAVLDAGSQRAEVLAAQTVVEARQLYEWLREVLPRR